MRLSFGATTRYNNSCYYCGSSFSFYNTGFPTFTTLTTLAAGVVWSIRIYGTFCPLGQFELQQQ
jgi:hypothetical protein